MALLVGPFGFLALLRLLPFCKIIYCLFLCYRAKINDVAYPSCVPPQASFSFRRLLWHGAPLQLLVPHGFYVNELHIPQESLLGEIWGVEIDDDILMVG